MFTFQNLLNLSWSTPILVRTANGPRMLSKCRVPSNNQDFWTFYKENRNMLKAKNYSMSKDINGNWEMCLWDLVSGQPVEPKIENIQKQPTEISKTEISAEIKSKLLDYQIPHVTHLIDVLQQFGRALDASEMGTGKTYSAIAIAIALKCRIIVVCPKAIISGWKKAAAHFGFTDILMIVNYDLLKNGKMIQEQTTKRGLKKQVHVLCPYLKVTTNPNKGKYECKYLYEWTIPENTLVIFDEAHKSKNFTTFNAQMMVQLADQTSAKILLLSGTIAEDPMKLKAVSLILHVIQDTYGFYNWVANYGCRKVPITYGVSAWKFVGRNTDIIRLHNDLFPLHGARLRKDEIPNFPANQIVAEPINLNGNAVVLQENYDETLTAIEEWAQATAAERETMARSGKHPLAVLQHLRMASETLKVPAVIEMAQDLMDEGYSVAIFTNFTETLHAIAQGLDTNCIYYGGNTNVRQANVEKFQNNDSNVIILNIAAGGQSISLHDELGGHPRVSLIFPTYHAQDLEQATGRIHRAGAKSKAIQYILFAADTIEEKICERVKDKLINLKLLNDGECDVSSIMKNEKIGPLYAKEMEALRVKEYEKRKNENNEFDHPTEINTTDGYKVIL